MTKRFLKLWAFPAAAWVAAAWLVAVPAANAKPNFTGTWKMNADKSEFGEFPGPASRVDKIDHQDPDFKISTQQSTQQGDISADLAYKTDGSETTNTIRGNDVKSHGSWDGDTLVIDSKASFNGNEVTIKDKWSLAEDGKSITIQRHFSAPQGEADQKVVMEKQ